MFSAVKAAFFEAQSGPFAKRGFEWRGFDYTRFKIMKCMGCEEIGRTLKNVNTRGKTRAGFQSPRKLAASAIRAMGKCLGP